MPTVMSSILRAATRLPDEPLNILSFPTHERHSQVFGLTPHNYYLYQANGIKTWNDKFGDLPHNTTLLRPNTVPDHVDFDVIISQNKFGQFTIAKQLSRMWHVPMISLEHTLPPPGWNDAQISQLKKQRGEVNVFLSDYSRQAWNFEDVETTTIVGPGIDDSTFMPMYFLPKKRAILSVVNDWINRDWACGYNLWRAVTKDLPVSVLGDTPGLSEPAKDISQLVSAYQRSQVFLNTSLVSTCPFTLLEAMACGCAVVSTATTMIPQIIKDGVNGFCSNDPRTLRYRCELLLDNPVLAEQLGREARKTIEEKFSFRRMAADWDSVLRSTANIVIKG